MKFKKILSRKLLIITVVILGIPVSLYLALQVQRFRSRGVVGNTIISFAPEIATISAGGNGTTSIFLNPNGDLVYAIQLVIDYDPNLITVNDITPGPFFTDVQSTVGVPVEVIKNISSGRIYYSVAFPLGSHFSSSSAKTAAYITFTTKKAGCTGMDFVLNPTQDALVTMVSDINANNVLKSTMDGKIESGAGSCTLISPSPTPGACNTCYNFNGGSDGIIDVQDVLYVANRWNLNSGNSNYNTIYDVYCSSTSPPDGSINVLDVQTVANRWGTGSCTP